MTQGGQAVEVAPAPQLLRRSGWRRWWQPAILAGLIGFIYYPVLIKLVHDWWNDPDFSHGFFVPLFSAFLIWTQRETLWRIESKPAWSGLAVVAVSLFFFTVGTFANDLFFPRVAIVLLVAGLVILFCGWAQFRAAFFAWAFLFLMIPIPAVLMNQITFPLQLLASRLASAVLPIVGVPVLREGNVIHLPAMPLEVAEACSGIRSLLSLVTLAVIYGYFLDSKTWRRCLLVIAAVPIAVVANALRIVGTGIAVQYWNPDRALGFFHEFSGWVIFIVSLALLLAVHGALRFISSRAAPQKP
ncbi:MAG: exosortase/archaeosortase family protein [Acidobacteriia bacterium]|nr:exosortase/archaeosortase family protein [Terriglobia bacterium]